MSKGYICVYDSGIGGISVLEALKEVLPNESYIYIGDNLNAPYGNKSHNRLVTLAMSNLLLCCEYPIKAIVLGCNTLSVTVAREIEQYLDVPIFRVYPPVEGQMLNNKKTLLLCTPNTARNFVESNNLRIVCDNNLVPLIEHNVLNIHNINLESYFANYCVKKGYYDTVILGCTHYLFIKNQVINHFCPQNVISGNDNTVLMVKRYLQKTKSLVKYKCFNDLFLGNNAIFNKNIYFEMVKNGFFSKKN